MPVVNACGNGPCCAAPRWPDCRDCPHYPPTEKLLNAMEDARPADAPPLHWLGQRSAVEAEQMAAFEAGEPQWWLIGEGGVRYDETVPGLWEAVDEEDTTPAE